MKRASETAEQRELRLKKRRESYHKKKQTRDNLNRHQDETQIQYEGRLPESDRTLL